MARGLSGTALVISDAHHGLVDADRVPPSAASWQRCRTHFMRNLLTRVPKSAQAFVATLGADDLRPARRRRRSCAQHARVVEQLRPTSSPTPPTLLADGRSPTCWRSPPFPKEHWQQVWSNNPQERLNRELRRRTDVVGIFPNRDRRSSDWSAQSSPSSTTSGPWPGATWPI